MSTSSEKNSPDWVIKGKTIEELIHDLQSFEDKSMKVEISLDEGATSKPISILMRIEGKCVIANCQ